MNPTWTRKKAVRKGGIEGFVKEKKRETIEKRKKRE